MKKLLQGLPTRHLPLRMRLAVWSAILVLCASLGLLLFINVLALKTFPGIVGSPELFGGKGPPTASPSTASLPSPPPLLEIPFLQQPLSPLAQALLFQLQSISLIGLGVVALAGGLGAYYLAGAALRPLRKVTRAAYAISASTLHTRLMWGGPKDEIKDLADTFDEMLGRLEHTFDLQKRFMGDIAHELRTPLATMRTNLEVVMADKQATLEDYRLMSVRQERAVLRLERLIADFLLLARSEQIPEASCVSLPAMLDDILHELHPIAGKKHVSLHLTGAEDIVVQGDPSLLMRAFSNLIENGIHYNRVGGSVTINIERQGAIAEVSIRDTGIGMTATQKERIFDRFYRTEASRSRHTGGAGLGLSIVKAIVHQHKGEISIESAPQRGSVFTVRLPSSSVP